MCWDDTYAPGFCWSWTYCWFWHETTSGSVSPAHRTKMTSSVSIDYITFPCWKNEPNLPSIVLLQALWHTPFFFSVPHNSAIPHVYTLHVDINMLRLSLLLIHKRRQSFLSFCPIILSFHKHLRQHKFIHTKDSLGPCSIPDSQSVSFSCVFHQLPFFWDFLLSEMSHLWPHELGGLFVSRETEKLGKKSWNGACKSWIQKRGSYWLKVNSHNLFLAMDINWRSFTGNKTEFIYFEPSFSDFSLVYVWF